MGELGYLETRGHAGMLTLAHQRGDGGPGHRGAPGTGDPRRRLARASGETPRSRGSSCDQLQLGRKAAALETGPLPRLARPAPSYKLGERIWLQARTRPRPKAGAAFSLKDFHSRALSLGVMDLDPLRDALARFQALTHRVHHRDQP